MKKLKDSLKYHFVDSTALLAESTPVFAAFEVGLSGMSDEVSLNARLLAAGLTYFAGMGWAYSKGRDLYRKLLDVKETSKEGVQTFHDAVYTGPIFNAVVAPLIYLRAGARDPKEIAIATAAAVVFGAANGPFLGYAIDIGRDLTGLRNCERPSYPESLKRMGSKTKMGLAALLTAGTIALTAGIYSATPEQQESQTDIPSIEQVVKTD